METSRAELLRPVLPEAALYGLPGEIARSLAESSGADPASILGMFMTMFGNAIGRQPHVMFYGHEEPGRLFTLIVGKWARGRKGTAWNAVRKLFIPAEPDWAAKNIESGLQSAEAMIEAVADSPTADPRLLVLETEFARFVYTMTAQRKFSSQMRTAYDGETLSRKRVSKAPLISTQHMISLIGMITPGELIALQKLSGGLESRVLYFYSAPGRKATTADPFGVDEGQIALSEKVRDVIGRAWDNILGNADPISAELAEIRGVAPSAQFRISDDVADNWKSVIAAEIEELHDRIGEDFERYTARGQTHVIRLSLLYALADGASEIEWAHVRAAMALWEFCALSARRIFSVPDDPKPRINPIQQGKVFDFLLELQRDADESQDEESAWASIQEITNEVLSNNTPATPILDDLEEQGLVESRKLATGARGRPRIEYRVIISSLNSYVRTFGRY